MDITKDMTDKDLARELLGKSIRAITETEAGALLELDDGTLLELRNFDECCAWYHVTLEAVDLSDNAITAVKRVDRRWNKDPDAKEQWQLNVFSNHKKIAKVNIAGDEGTGEYGSSITLIACHPNR